MPVNPIFQAGNQIGTEQEQSIVQQLVDEIIQIHGHDLIYIPRTEVKLDPVFGEDVLSRFDKYYTIEMYIETIDIYGGAGDILGKFGLEITDSMSAVVSRNRFRILTGMNSPREGDLIYFPTGRAIFEIKFVEDEIPFYTLGKMNTFKLSLELFHYSQEDMNTGNEDVDSLAKALENVNDPSNDPFADNEVYEDEVEEVLFSESRPFGRF